MATANKTSGAKKKTASKSSSKSSQGGNKSATSKTGGAKKSTASKSSSAGRTGATKSTGTAKKAASKGGAAKSSTAAKRGGSKTSTANKSGGAGKRTASGGAKSSGRSATAKKSASKTTGTANSGRTAAPKRATTTASAKKAAPAKKSAAKSPAKKATAKSPAKTATKRTAPSRSSAKKSATKRSNGKGIFGTVAETVSSLFGQAKPNAIDLLKSDHRKVEGYFEQVKANEDGNNRDLYKNIKFELDAHAHIEETIFYPYLLEKGDEELQKIVREGIEEHRQAKLFLAELNDLHGDNDRFKAKMQVLMEDIEHHVEEEENEMFPMVEDQINADKIESMGDQMAREKMLFQERMPSPPELSGSAAGGSR